MTPFLPPTTTPWATYIENRRPAFKVHSSLARARAALRVRDSHFPRGSTGEQKLYEWTADGWQERS